MDKKMGTGAMKPQKENRTGVAKMKERQQRNKELW
jgi:hypothetical protein